MDIAALLQQATSGKIPVEGARLAHFMQLAQFVNTAQPCVIKAANLDVLEEELKRIHHKGGIIVSVDFREGLICAYMPQEKKNE